MDTQLPSASPLIPTCCQAQAPTSFLGTHTGWDSSCHLPGIAEGTSPASTLCLTCFPVPGCSSVTTATALSGRGDRRQAGVEAAFPASAVCVPAEELPRQPQCLPAASSPAVSTSPTHTEDPSQAPSHKSLLKQACRLRWVPRRSNGVSFACPRSSASSHVLLQSQAGAGGPSALLQCRQARWPGWRSCRSRCTHRGSPGLWLRSPHRGTGIDWGQNCVG